MDIFSANETIAISIDSKYISLISERGGTLGAGILNKKDYNRPRFYPTNNHLLPDRNVSDDVNFEILVKSK